MEIISATEAAVDTATTPVPRVLLFFAEKNQKFPFGQVINNAGKIQLKWKKITS